MNQASKDDNLIPAVASDSFATDSVDETLSERPQQLPAAADYPLWRIQTVVSDEKATAGAASSAFFDSEDGLLLASGEMKKAGDEAFYVDRDWRLLAPSTKSQLRVAEGRFPQTAVHSGGGRTMT